jgi:hypothetical protein
MKKENWRKKHALILAGQLPENQEDALIVLRLTTELVTGFLADPEPAQRPTVSIVRIGGNESA